MFTIVVLSGKLPKLTLHIPPHKKADPELVKISDVSDLPWGDID